MSHLPILSVIIPTRDRFKYAKHAVRAVLSNTDLDCELVVHDNSHHDDLSQWIQLEYGADQRLRYRRVTEPLDISENFERALDLATGEYFCFIGDDDGINPEIVQATRWAHAHDVDAVLPMRSASYYWPDLLFRYGGNRCAGQLHVRPFRGQITWCDVEEELRRCVRSGGQNFGHLPRVYFGILKRQCIERVREKCGRYLPGVSPDMAGAVAAASFVKKMCLVDYPLFVPGASGGSASGLGAMKKDVGSLEDQVHLSPKFIVSWPEQVPRFFAGSTMWAAATIQALRATGREELLASFNTPQLHACCAVFAPQCLPSVLRSFHKAICQRPAKYPTEVLRFFIAYSYCWGQRAERLYANFTKSDGAQRINNVPNIYDAICKLTHHIKGNNCQFDQVFQGNLSLR